MISENRNSLIYTISKNIKKYRKNKGLSQMELANLINSSQSHIGEIETSKKSPSIKLIEEIAEALDIKPYQLLLNIEDDIPGDYREIIKNEINDELKETINEYFKKG